MVKVDAKRLEEISARHKAASPGPWEAKPQAFDETHVRGPRFTGQEGEVSDADGQFIANSHQDVPDLVDDLREARTAIRTLLDAIDYTTGACRLNEMVGAVLPRELIDQAKGTIE